MSDLQKSKDKKLAIMTGNSLWAKKIAENQNHWASNSDSINNGIKKSVWRPPRFSGRYKFQKSRIGLLGNSLMDPIKIQIHYPTFGNQFSEYCQSTSLHGFRYITERKRSLCERVFWICCCLFGISGAAYMMSKIWQRWASNPVITSVATTNLPVSDVLFPAVTICTVNKAVNEKLIIQGCRYNKTFSQMRAIISALVDSKSENNDHVTNSNNYVTPSVALRYLRLVAPKCDDYLLRCHWNSKKQKPCSLIFKMVLTDTGYCCTFNSIQSKSIRIDDGSTNKEVMEQEAEYDIMQKAVWSYVDAHGKPAEENVNTTLLPEDSATCLRVYSDELFPGICAHLKKCRANPKSCDLGASRNTSTESPPLEIPSHTNSGEVMNETVPELLKAPGAGRSRGLNLMTDTLRCDTVPTDSFKGLRVYVHGVDEFPAVGERGFLVGPGMETQARTHEMIFRLQVYYLLETLLILVGVTAVDTYSVEALRMFQPENRGCFFTDERPLQYHKNYSRSACVVECETSYVQQNCECVPYYNPGNYSICEKEKMISCVPKYIDEIQKKQRITNDVKQPGKTMFQFKRKDLQQQKSCTEECLPACNETFYNIVVTAADFPNQPHPNMTKSLREAIRDGYTFLNEIKYVSGSISLLRVYFREPSIMQYKRDELFTWEDFVSNMGGVMGLCLGFSLLSLIEVIYFFTLRLCMDRRRYMRELDKNNMILEPPVFRIKI